MTTKKTNPAPLTIEVVNTRSVEDILTRTKGLLELIEVACNSASGDYGEVTDIFGPQMLKSLSHLCRFTAHDLDLVEIYLSDDAVAFHQNQVEELAAQAPAQPTTAAPAPQE